MRFDEWIGGIKVDKSQALELTKKRDKMRPSDARAQNTNDCLLWTIVKKITNHYKW